MNNTWAKVPKYLKAPMPQDEFDLLAMNEVSPDVEAMAATASPIQKVPPPAQASAPAQVAPAPKPIREPAQSVSVSESYSTKTMSPGMEAEAERLRNQLETLRQSRLAEEQAGIEDYGRKIQEYESKPTGIDWRPLAGLLDQWAGGKAALTAAEAVKPESPELKRDKLALMREKLNAMKGGLSNSQYSAVKDQLDSLKAQMNAEAAEKKFQASMNQRDKTMERLSANDVEKQVIDMSKRLGDVNAVVIAQKIDRLNQNIPGGLFGKGDVPGIGIGKNWSPQFLFSDEGSTIRQDAKALLVESIKAATGLAATEAEQQAQAQINGLSKSSTAREFREALAKQVQDNLARASEIVKTYRPEAQETYKKRQGKTVVDVLESVNSKNPAAKGGINIDQNALDAELKRRGL